MKSILNSKYINYKVYFMPEVFIQRINPNKVPKLFIVIDDQPYFPRLVYVYGTKSNFIQEIRLPDLTEKIFDALALT